MISHALYTAVRLRPTRSQREPVTTLEKKPPRVKAAVTTPKPNVVMVTQVGAPARPGSGRLEDPQMMESCVELSAEM